MIRGVRHYSLAVRRPDGKIFCVTEPVSSRLSGRVRRIPFVRGVLILAETLWLGMKSLQRSAIIAADDASNSDATATSTDVGDSQIGGWTMGVTMAVALALGVGIFLVLPLLAVRLIDPFIGSSIVSNLIEGVIRLTILVAYVTGISAMKDIRRVYAYHGAEHMTVHAYEAGLPLNVDNVRRFGTPHPRCGTAFLLTVVFVSVAVFVAFSLLELSWWWRIASRVLLLPAIAAVSYEIIRFSGQHPRSLIGQALAAPGLWLQRLTTRQPDDAQIEVAIRAMETAVAADSGAVRASA
jgi:uncharacterized protein YqhQ